MQENDNILLQLVTGILHNVAQDEETVPELREMGVIEATKPYLESHVAMRRLSCLAILADVVNEQESQLLQSNNDSIAFLIKCLNTAVAEKARRSNGWSAREIARSKFFAATMSVKSTGKQGRSFKCQLTEMYFTDPNGDWKIKYVNFNPFK